MFLSRGTVSAECKGRTPLCVFGGSKKGGVAGGEQVVGDNTVLGVAVAVMEITLVITEPGTRCLTAAFCQTLSQVHETVTARDEVGEVSEVHGSSPSCWPE